MTVAKLYEKLKELISKSKGSYNIDMYVINFGYCYLDGDIEIDDKFSTVTLYSK